MPHIEHHSPWVYSLVICHFSTPLLFLLFVALFLLSIPSACEMATPYEFIFVRHFPVKLKWKDTANLFSPPPHHKCWQDSSTIPDLLRSSQNTLTHIIAIISSAFDSAESGMVWKNLMMYNVTSIYSIPGQASRCTTCPLFKGERGLWSPLNQPDCKAISE